MKPNFWDFLQALVDTRPVVIDRSKMSSHTRYPDSTSPVDYWYLAGTTSMDSGGVDVWVGSLKDERVVSALCIVDLLKKDTELKIVMDCTKYELRSIIHFARTNLIQSIFIDRRNEEEQTDGVDS